LVIPRLTLRHYKNIEPDLMNLFREISIAWYQADNLHGGPRLNGKYMATFIAFTAVNLQPHIKMKMKKLMKPGNHASILRNKNLDRAKTVNTLKLMNQQEIDV
jgi:hypothetical protein